MVDIEALVPQDPLLQKIEKVMDYDWSIVVTPVIDVYKTNYDDIITHNIGNVL